MTEYNFSQFIADTIGKQNSEYQQAGIRALFAIAVFAYVIISDLDGIDADSARYLFWGAFVYLLASVSFLALIRFRPSTAVIIRKLGIILDLTFIGFAMILGGPITPWGYGGYLWVTIANGLRFGKRYLQLAQAGSVTCFCLVLAFSDYWHDNLSLGIGLLVWLILLPLYVSRLLQILENSMAVANSANQAKSAFLANMSHEIRTPLTTIIGYAELALDGNQTPEEHNKSLNTIVRSGNHLLTLINNILDLSKIEANQIDVEFISVDLFQLLADVECIMKPLAEKKGLEFTIGYELPLPERIGTDPVRLKQILINLCSNAIKFTDNGSVSINVSCTADKHLLAISVQDTGIGMTDDQVKRLFRPFQQADTSITRRFGGTGLGLSLSCHLAKILGGTILVDSEPGAGSLFTLSVDTGSLLHTRFVHDLTRARRTTESDTINVEMNRLDGKILLAEDNRSNQELLSLFLRRMGAEVDVADNGEAAVALASAGRYDLIFMDMQMPIMSGLDAVTTLRQQGYSQPVVALTANASNEDKLRCMAAGCNEFLTKPVSRARLYQATARYLRPATGPSAGEAITSTLLDEDPSLLDLVENFVARLPEIIHELRQDCERSDWAGLKEKLHDLKGMGGGHGYTVLSELAEKAEQQLKQNDHDAVKDSLEKLLRVSDRIRAGMQAADTDFLCS